MSLPGSNSTGPPPSDLDPRTGMHRLSVQELEMVGQTDPLVKETLEAVHDTRVRGQFEEVTARNAIYLKALARKYYIILLVIIGAIVIAIVMIIADVYLKYGSVVSMYSKYKSPGMPSGLHLGIALRVPVLAGWMGFTVRNFPEAVYISYMSSSLHDKFMDDPKGNILDMWNWSLFWVGSSGSASANNSAIAIVCNSWNWQNGEETLTECESPCSNGSGNTTAGWTSAGISAATQFGMMAPMGPVGIGVATISAGLSFATAGGLFSHHHHPENCIS